MESQDGGTTDSRVGVHGLAARWPVLVVTLVMVLSVSAPMAAGATGNAPVERTGDVAAQHSDAATVNAQWTDPPGAFDQAQANDTGEDEKRQAAEDGVDEAVTTLQRQGVSVNQSQRAAAVNGTLEAVSQYQNASVEQVQNASQGAVAGAFLQSQNVTVEQVQNATYGGASGALSQHQNASATQLQHAAYGATHGAVAQGQNASIEQVQVVAQGAAAGAAHEAGKRDRNESRKKAHPGAVREAAQGAAFGALSQKQNVTVEQRQSAAVGAAEGALTQNQSVAVEQRQTASVKQVQVAAMGAAEGALSVTQRQEVTVRQVQAAARGACGGALRQSQSVSVTQIQTAAQGAAQGAISQSQSASVTQIQAAASGGAQGAVVQRQSVSITQVQHAAAGAAKGAARSAVQNQVVNVEQIQAAAAGAGQGSIVQIQQINVVQIQVISEGAADGALSQHQEASVVQIQSAARGASEGATSLTQRQEVSIEQTQVVTQRAASDTAATAARLNIDVDQTIYNYAKGSSEDPDDGDQDDGGQADDEERLQSLFASADEDTIFLANPNDEPVTVTITSDEGDMETLTLAAGESTNVERDRGTYTLTAETADGEDVELAGRDELTVSVGDALQSLTASVDDQTLAVENPNDERVTVDVSGDVDASFDVPGNWDETLSLGAGEYTATAETQDGEAVQINGDDVYEFGIESAEPEPEPNETEPEPNETEPEPPEPVELNASAEDGNLTVENPSEADVDVTVAPEDGDNRTVDVSAGETVTESFDSGNYTVTGDAEGDRAVLINGQSAFDFTVTPPEAVDLNVTVDGQNVTVENPSETDVTANVTSDNGDSRPFDVPADENVTESFAPGNYTLTGDAEDDRDVLVDGQSDFEFTVEQPSAIDVNVTVEGQNVSFDNPSETAVTVTAADENDSEQTVEVPADENVTETFDPGNYTLTGSAADDRSVVLDGDETAEVNVTEEPADDPVDLNVTVDGQNVSVENPSDVDVEITAANETGENLTVDVAADENVTETFDPGNYTLTGESEDEREVLFDGESSLDVQVVGPDEPESLNATVEDGNVTVANPNDAPVTVTASPDDGENRTFDAPPAGNVTETFEPGNYTLTAESEDGAVVPVDGQSAFEFTVEPTTPIDLNVTVSGQNVSVENANDTDVTVTATDEANETRTIPVAAGENVTETFDPGNYTLTGESEDGREVRLDGESALAIQVTEPTEAVDSLNVTVEGENVTVTNPNDAPVTVTASPDDGENRTVDVTPESSVTEQFEPGNYTVTAATDDEVTVPVNETTEHDITVQAAAPTATGTLTVDDQTGDGSEFVVANASATVPFVLDIDYEDGTATSERFDADETLSNATVALDPPLGDDSTVTVTVRAAETDDALANETVEYEVAEPFANVSAADQTTNGSAAVVQYANLTAGGFLAVHENSTFRSDDVIGSSAYLPPGEYENVSVALSPALDDDATVNVTAHRDSDGDEAFDFVATDGAEDEPYVAETGEPVTSSAELTVETGPEPGVEYVNCTAAQVNGTYDRLGVTLGYYDTDGNATGDHLRTAADVPADRPVDGRTLVTVGETNETTVTEDGVLVVQVADPGAFGEENRSFVANVNASASPTGDGDLNASQPDSEQCRADVRPEAPTLGTEPVDAVDNETALLNFSYENPNDASMEPAESLFTGGEVADEPPAVLESGENFVVVEWTPESPDEAVTWTANLSNFDLTNVSTASPTAADVPGLLEPPAETESPTPDATDEPTPETGDDLTPEPADEPTPEQNVTDDGTPTPEPDDEPEETPTPEPEPEDGLTPEPDDGPTAENATA